MIINSQGFGHFMDGLNNQDFGIESSRMLLILDGCSGAKYSEIGTRLFTQLFLRKEEYDNLDKFEENVKSVFETIIKMAKPSYPNEKELQEEFIMENLLFTIIACFELEDKFVIKMFGDGYILTINNQNCLSYCAYKYGKYPPYYAYKYCDFIELEHFDNFKTFEFSKKDFKNIGIASDGIVPIVKGEVEIADTAIINNNQQLLDFTIKKQRQIFYDDITIAIFGGD